ncbi:MAG: LytTR family transcriptional regulator [Bacteroidales bacterium]|nr:LytTR family transcriptional regulator [Bacteroidales bacterium]MCF8391092.1 LytTR family transcriptional regulator [Bacteroidales bacterium]
MRIYRDEFRRLFYISFGVFLFILFFQPFPLEMLDYEYRLMFVSGFGALTFFLSVVVLIFLPLSIPKWIDTSEGLSEPPFLLNLLLFILMITAYVFYIRYVGNISLSLYILFKILLVNLFPLILLLILYKNISLERDIQVLQHQNKSYYTELQKYIEVKDELEIEILSDNKSENLALKLHDIVYIKSADNYIEIYYLSRNAINKKLIRTTLKNIEKQLAAYNHFIRCHRRSIVNVKHIEKLIRNYSGYHLQLKYFNELIPVSRQYLLLVKGFLE